MNDSSMVLRISAGRGPHEARRFVGLLANAVCRRLADAAVRVQAVERHGEPDAPGRVALRLPEVAVADIQQLLGTHLLVADLRGARARRRWFALVELDERPASTVVELPRHELDVRFVRSRGPGGQNVNKRATAVQITHRPTSIAVACDRHRSQARNRAAAMESLRQAIARHLHEHARVARREHAWQSRRELPNQTPVMRWRLDPFERDAIIPA